jgi:DNA repair exonuclease SbcCD ATPase subunit
MILKKVKFKNFLSYGNNFTEIIFKNGLDIVVAKNGQGKSAAFLDTLTFAFFGKPFRKIKLGSLINNKNKKELLVEVEFKTDKNYKIKRGLKPSIFEIYFKENNEWKLIPQDGHSKDYQEKLEEILGFNEILFKQIVVLGANISNVKNFMDLSVKEKEEIFQNLTNTFIFNIIVQLAKEKRNFYQTEITNLEFKKNSLKENINNLKNEYAKIEKQNEEIVKNKEKKINEINKEIKNLEILKEKIESKLLIKNDLNKEILQIMTKKEEIQEKINKIQNAKNILETKLELYKNSEEIKCPKCSHTFKQHNLDFNEIENKIKLLNEKLSEFKKEITPIIEKEKLILEKQEKIQKLENKLSNINITLNQLKHNKKIYEETKLTKIDYNYLKEKEKELNDLILDINEKIKIKNNYEKIISLIVDGKLKEQILSQQLPILNKYINEYLEKFNVEYNFIIENNLKEKILKRNEEQEFHSLSNGQKQRVVLAILFAFLKIMEYNGYKINILILDEFLDSSLDEDGIEIIIDILINEFIQKKNIIIITHNPTIINKINANRIFKIENEFGYSKLISKGEK